MNHGLLLEHALQEVERLESQLSERYLVGHFRQIETHSQTFRGNFMGFYRKPPVVGECFEIWGQALEGFGRRQVVTSEVKQITKETSQEIVFQTVYSLYVLTYFR